ncbi:uncharacterized protein METZ01_LOCUS63701 [marine metagenome]|uniref:Uncharacterized protein n=1 Tax=marine metagenome TaxID=408172 RepID=A0A381T826_9ZZZZ
MKTHKPQKILYYIDFKMVDILKIQWQPETKPALSIH